MGRGVPPIPQSCLAKKIWNSWWEWLAHRVNSLNDFWFLCRLSTTELSETHMSFLTINQKDKGRGVTNKTNTETMAMGAIQWRSDTVDYSSQIEKLRSLHWGSVTDSQRVTYTAFAIFAMFWLKSVSYVRKKRSFTITETKQKAAKKIARVLIFQSEKWKPWKPFFK